MARETTRRLPPRLGRPASWVKKETSGYTMRFRSASRGRTRAEARIQWGMDSAAPSGAEWVVSRSHSFPAEGIEDAASCLRIAVLPARHGRRGLCLRPGPGAHRGAAHGEAADDGRGPLEHGAR